MESQCYRQELQNGGVLLLLTDHCIDLARLCFACWLFSLGAMLCPDMNTVYANITGVTRAQMHYSESVNQHSCCVSCMCLKAIALCNAERIAQSTQLHLCGYKYNSLPAPLPAPCVPSLLQQVQRSRVLHLFLLHILV